MTEGHHLEPVERYAALAESLREGPPGWVAARRGAARALREAGLPTARDEAWKYTRAAALLQRDWHLADGDGPVPDVDADVVLVDGHLVRCAPPAGVDVRSVREAGDVGRVVATAGFAALNLALARDGVAVRVPAGVEARLVVVHVATGHERLGAVRHVVVAERGAKLQLVERFVGDGAAMTSAVTELELAEGAEVVHLREQHEGREAVHHGVVGANVGAGARYTAISTIGGAATTRVELGVALRAPGAEVHLHGLTLVSGAEHADHHVRIEHAAPGCTSRQAFRALCDGRGRSVFTGNVVVAPGAAGTDAAQVHRALVLSEDAVANARPQLEIRCDDVRCSHGATVGALDEEALFYLRQRGLDQGRARALLTEAFAAEIVDAVPHAGDRDALRARVATWLEAS